MISDLQAVADWRICSIDRRSPGPEFHALTTRLISGLAGCDRLTPAGSASSSLIAVAKPLAPAQARESGRYQVAQPGLEAIGAEVAPFSTHPFWSHSPLPSVETPSVW